MVMSDGVAYVMIAILVFLPGCGSTSTPIRTNPVVTDTYQHLTYTLIASMDSVILLEECPNGTLMSYPDVRICITQDDRVMTETRKHLSTDTVKSARLSRGTFERLIGQVDEARFFSSLNVSEGCIELDHSTLVAVTVKEGSKQKCIAARCIPNGPGGAQRFYSLVEQIRGLAPPAEPTRLHIRSNGN